MIVMGFYDDGLICRECGKAFDSKLALKNHKSLHNKQSCSICGNEISKKNFKRRQERCKKKYDARSEVVAEQVEVAAQLFSATYAAAFRLSGENDKADVVAIINNWLVKPFHEPLTFG